MSLEDQVRKQLEQTAAQEQCPVEDNVDAAFAMRLGITAGKKPTPPKDTKGILHSQAKGIKARNKASGHIPQKRKPRNMMNDP